MKGMNALVFLLGVSNVLISLPVQGQEIVAVKPFPECTTDSDCGEFVNTECRLNPDDPSSSICTCKDGFLFWPLPFRVQGCLAECDFVNKENSGCNHGYCGFDGNPYPTCICKKGYCGKRCEKKAWRSFE
ncbi:protein glp-1-like [Saccostrea cucullata]|uniref:protein glp-1-like n=1 Tax=Saccostrea cuccullata TaxID=36930 RepID=UPI002ED48BDA